MKHFSKQKWTDYVNNTLPVVESQELENHLYSCESCLDLYLNVISEQETKLPYLTNNQTFTDSVISQITKVKEIPMDKFGGKKPFYQTAVFHYLLAAAMTVLLVSTGVFQSIAHYVGIVQTPTFQKEQSTVTEEVLNKTLHLVDSVQKNNEVKK